MKDEKFLYKDIIGFQKHFHPVYLLDEEYAEQWKQFIPNENFFAILNKVLDTLKGETYRKSFWMQGTYGVGKSHATAVIKHLLWDAVNKIEDYLEKIDDKVLKIKIEQFRKSNNVLPIVIKGVSDITDNQTFKWVIEKNVKDQLKQLGIDINIESDFEKWLQQIEEEIINVEKIINNSELKAFVKNKEELVSKLKNKDVQILKKLKNAASELRISVFSENIGNWLRNVHDFLVSNNHATHLMIYWDEFTSVLDLENSGPILNELQKIAELSENYNVFLYLISHRKPLQSEIKKEDYEHVLDRFYVFEYTMNPITSYHLIRAAIKIKDRKKFEELINKYVSLDVEKVIDNIIREIDSPEISKELKEIFPIHPYTGYILTFIARHIGSSDRSIFTFLNDSEKGFIKFINEHPQSIEDIFLTVDYLWDYFENQFETLEESERVRNILNIYYSNKDKFKDKDSKYLAVFKSILLLNILRNYVTREKLVSPSVETIKNIYAGVISEKELKETLDFIDKERIVYKSPNDEFIIQTFASYKPEEFEETKNNLQKQYDNSESIAKLIEYKVPIKEQLKSELRTRISKFEIMPSNIRESQLRNRLDNLKANKPYELKIIYFPLLKLAEEVQLKDLLKKISAIKDYQNFIYIIGKTPFEEDKFNKFIHFLTLSKIAAKKDNFSEEQRNRENAEKLVFEWLENHKVNSEFIFKGKEIVFYPKKIIELSKEIFKYGLENTFVKNENLWKVKKPEKTIENIVLSENLEDFISRTDKSKKDKDLRLLFKIDENYFVDNDFKSIKNEYKNQEHPVIKIYQDFQTEMNKEKEYFDFDLFEKMRKYQNIPYGYFPNEVHAAVLSFLIRPFIGKLYNLEGKLLKENDFIEILQSLLKNWDKGNEFSVTFEAVGEEKEKLKNILSYIFDISEAESIDDSIKLIKDKINENKIYLFLLNEELDEEEKNKLNLIVKILTEDDWKTNPQDIKSYVSKLEAVKGFLKEKLSSANWQNLLENFITKEIEGTSKKEDFDLTEENKRYIIELIQNKLDEKNVLYTHKENIKEWINDIIKALKITKKTTPVSEGKGEGSENDKEIEDIDINELIDNFSGDLKRILKEIVMYFPDVKKFLIDKLRSDI